jgi:hypothetical protein
MHLQLRRFPGALGAALVLGLLPLPAIAQQAESAPPPLPTTETATDAIPDAPLPQLAMQADGERDGQAQPAQSTQAPAGTQAPASAQESTSSQGQAPATGDQQKISAEEQRRKAQEQLEEQEKQRVMGVMATFNTTRNPDALPLSSGQKFQLFFKSETDPWPFLLAGVVAGINQADDSDEEWGQGAQGYAKRFGAAYTDSFIGNFFGNAVLTSWWHEDPRYYQKGTGSWEGRALWAATSTVWCKRDKGTWGPNYANVAGNLIGSAIARIYYPASERHVGDTIIDGLTVSAEGIVGSEVIEFWPDMVRRYRRKHAEKLAREEAKKKAQDGSNAQEQPKQAPPK